MKLYLFVGFVCASLLGGSMIYFGLGGRVPETSEQRAERRKNQLESGTKVHPYMADQTFVVAEIHAITDFKLRRVLLKREKDGWIFQAIADSSKELKVGQRVEIMEIRYMHHADADGPESFFAIK